MTIFKLKTKTVCIIYMDTVRLTDIFVPVYISAGEIILVSNHFHDFNFFLSH